MTTVKPFFIKAITPLHAGSGSDLGVVDLPIQRESHTGFPKIEASSLKGSIRSEYSDDLDVETIFGTGKEAGKLGFSDARILFFPIKSVKGVFAYITCPMVLERLEENFKLEDEKFSMPKVTLSDEQCIVFGDKNKIEKTNKVVLEEYSFEVKEDKNLNSSIFDEVKERLVIVSDDNFTHFVKNSTEVITRIRIGDDGVVEQGGLFTEEYLPSETVMYALAIGDEKYIKDEKKILQIGGNTTLGKGIVELSISLAKKESKNG